MSLATVTVWLAGTVAGVALMAWWQPWQPTPPDRHADALERIAQALERLAEKL